MYKFYVKTSILFLISLLFSVSGLTYPLRKHEFKYEFDNNKSPYESEGIEKSLIQRNAHDSGEFFEPYFDGGGFPHHHGPIGKFFYRIFHPNNGIMHAKWYKGDIEENNPYYEERYATRNPYFQRQPPFFYGNPPERFEFSFSRRGHPSDFPHQNKPHHHSPHFHKGHPIHPHDFNGFYQHPHECWNHNENIPEKHKPQEPWYHNEDNIKPTNENIPENQNPEEDENTPLSSKSDIQPSSEPNVINIQPSSEPNVINQSSSEPNLVNQPSSSGENQVIGRNDNNNKAKLHPDIDIRSGV